MPRRICILAVLAAMLWFGGCAADPSILNERSAIVALNKAFAGPDFSLILGDIKFAKVAGIDPGSGRVPIDSLPVYRAFAELGLISFSNERDLSAGFTGWNDWFALTQAGVRYTATIAATGKAKADSRLLFQPGFGVFAGSINFNFGEYKVASIVASEAMSLNTEKFQVVSGLRSFDGPTDDLRKAYEAHLKPIDMKQKFKALLKYDPFASAWAVDSVVSAEASSTFDYDLVGRRIAELKLVGR